MRLCLITDSREILLSEQECARQRASVLDQIATPRSPYERLPGIVGVCALGSLAVSGLGYFTDSFDFILGGLFAFAVSAFVVIGFWRSDRSVGILTAQDRLAIVDSLQSWQLITENEAGALRAKIDEHYHAYPAA